jgi:hypothetical protein
MPRSLGNTIADSLDLTLGYAKRLRSGLTAERFARLAAPGGQTVDSNHPAFVYGHLSLYGSRIVEQLGGDAAAIKPSEKFAEVFSKDARCVDDPDGTIYPAMEEVLQVFDHGYDAALEALRAADDALLQQPNPLEGRMAELFPTLGSMHGFYVGGHAMMHLGQLSAWRRMEGLPPA